jgi:hypothetical protein
MEAEPDVRTVRTSPAQIEMSGPFGAATSRLALTVTPLRTDWALSATPTMTPSFDTMGPLPEVLPEFVARMRRWIALDQAERFPVQRLAIGATLHHQEETRAAGYERICRYLSNTLRIDPGTSSDLLFQINRFTGSASLPGTNVNRVNKWGVLAFRTVALAGGGALSISDAADSWSTTLELDISTAADRQGPLPDERLSEVLAELVRNAESIAADGDRA